MFTLGSLVPMAIGKEEMLQSYGSMNEGSSKLGRHQYQGMLSLERAHPC